MAIPASLIAEIDAAVVRGVHRQTSIVAKMSDLFIAEAARFSARDVALFDEILTRLAAKIEVSARALLARRLAPVPNAPPQVTRALARDEAADVACPVLAESDGLDDEALHYCASTSGPPQLLAIAARKRISTIVTDVLVKRGDRQVALTVAANPGASLSELGFDTLVHRAQGDDRLAEVVGARPEIPVHVFQKLLATASKTVQIKLAAENPRATGDVHRVVAEVSDRMRAQARAQSTSYAEASEAVASRKGARALSRADVAEFAAAGKLEETTVALARLSNASVGMVERAMMQERPEKILIIAKAAKLAWGDAKAILALRSRVLGITPFDIEQCLASFERLSLATAQRIIQLYQNRGGMADERRRGSPT